MPFVHNCSFPRTPVFTITSNLVKIGKPSPHKATHKWTIDNFDSVEAKGVAVRTDLIRTNENNGIAWYMVLKPNGDENFMKDTSTISLHLYIQISNTVHGPPNNEVFANCDVYILNNAGIPISSKSIKAQKFVTKPNPRVSIHYTPVGWGWKDFWTKDEYFRTNILSDNKLTIQFEIEFSTTLNDVLRNCSETSLKLYNHECNLVENFASLLDTGTFSDVVISTNKKDFQAHKVILAARSKVFAAMFQNDMTESQENIIHIEYMSHEAIEEMLRFIYTGKCEKLGDVAEELLAAADKYDLDKLKILCCKALRKALSIENASNILLMADISNSKELKSDVIEYIVCKASQVFITAGWKNLLSNVELTNEVFQSMARRLASYEAEEIQV